MIGREKPQGGREILKADASPESNEERKDREEKAHDLLERQYSFIPDKLRKKVEKVDFSMINDIVSHDFVRATGLSAEKMNLLEKTNVGKNASNDSFGNYEYQDNQINFNVGNINEFVQKQEIPEELYFLAITIHEFLHGVSRVVVWGTTKEKMKGVLTQRMIGYSVTREEGIGEDAKKEKLYVSFNEGVNERYTREVLWEYCRRTGNFKEEDIEKMKKLYSEGRGHYTREVEFVDFFIQEIAQDVGVDEETVWQAIKSGFFRGENFMDEELRRSLEELFGTAFSERLKNGELKEIVKERNEVMNIKKLKRKIEKRWKVFLKRIVPKT